MILDKWIRGYIEETENRSTAIPKGSKVDDCLKKHIGDINSEHIGMYCKSDYMILDVDGFGGKNDTSYEDMNNPNTFRKIIDELGCSTILIKTTHGGWNAIFKRPPRKKYSQGNHVLNCGLQSEIKNENGKVSIVRYGKIRDIIPINMIDDVDVLPLELRPVDNVKWENKHGNSLACAVADKGYAIDDYLHKFAVHAKLTADDKKRVLQFINGHILAKPWDITKFVEQIKGEIEKPKAEKDDIGTICDSMLNNFNIVKSNDKLYYYDGEIYRDFTKTARKFIGNCSTDKRNTFKNDCLTNLLDVLDNWKLHNYDADDTRYGVDLYEWIATKSELFNPVTLERKPFTDELFLRKKLSFDIPHESKPNMVDDIVSMLLQGNETDIKMWWEYQGYLLLRTINLEKMLTLNGGGSNGKTVLLDLATYALQGTCANYEFKNLFAKFGGLELENNYFIYAHEMTSNYIKDSTSFKEIVSNNTRQVEPKNKNYVTIENYNCKLMYANNGVTNMDANSAEAVARRQLPLMFEYKIEDKDKDPNFKNKWLIPENAERYLYLAVQHGQDLLKRGYFVLSERSQTALNNYVNELDSVKQWLDNCEDSLDKVVAKGVLYQKYRLWCKANEYNPCKDTQFGKRLMKYKPYTTTKVQLEGDRVNAYCFA